MKLHILLAAMLAAAMFPALAEQKTVTLDVTGMTCAACPITVKKALTKVDGVSSVEVSLDKEQAMVTFDDVKASVDALTRATTNAGYPSELSAKTK